MRLESTIRIHIVYRVSLLYDIIHGALSIISHSQGGKIRCNSAAKNHPTARPPCDQKVSWAMDEGSGRWKRRHALVSRHGPVWHRGVIGWRGGRKFEQTGRLTDTQVGLLFILPFINANISRNATLTLFFKWIPLKGRSSANMDLFIIMIH